MHKKFIEKINSNVKIDENKQENFIKFTNQLIVKITKNLENFRFNVIIANFHEMYNFYIKILDYNIEKNILLENYLKIIALLNPFIPHFTSECFEELSKFKKFPLNEWPKTQEKFLIEEKINLVIQINGKKRDILNIKKDLEEEKILELMNENKKLKNYINSGQIIKKIFIPNKIMNLIIK